MKQGSRAYHPRIFCFNTENPQSSIVHCRSKNRSRSFNVQAPSSIWLLARKEVIDDFDAMCVWYRRLGDVPRNDQAWQKEKRPAVFATPVAGGQLKLGEEVKPIVDGLRGCLGWR
jgi:hypothetical protein